MKLDGFCPICRRRTSFIASNDWWRDSLICQSCPNGSVPRERALAAVLNDVEPYWRYKRIHESSPADRGISVILRDECPSYVATQYFPEVAPGEAVGKFRNENLERQTFRDNSFDIVISLDVMEHVYNPNLAFAEIYRTLVPGGVYVCTFPVRKYLVEGAERRFEIMPDGSRVDHMPPEFHGNPVDELGGSIVTFDYGYDIHRTIAEWADFDVRVIRFHEKNSGILGEYTEVFLCRKRN